MLDMKIIKRVTALNSHFANSDAVSLKTKPGVTMEGQRRSECLGALIEMLKDCPFNKIKT